MLFSSPDGFVDNVHFNLHFKTAAGSRLFASEIQDILSYSLNMTNLIPEIDLDSLLITGEQSVDHGDTGPSFLYLIREKETRASADPQKENVP